VREHPIVAAVMLLVAAVIYYAACRKALRARDRFEAYRARDGDP
jgi:hypothetical protein